MSITRFKLVFFSPANRTRDILDHIFKRFPQIAGKIGDYEECAFVLRGTGQFRGVGNANPTIGLPGKLEHVEEDRVEFIINDKGGKEEVISVVNELKAVHPYEEVAFDVYKLEDI